MGRGFWERAKAFLQFRLEGLMKTRGPKEGEAICPRSRGGTRATQMLLCLELEERSPEDLAPIYCYCVLSTGH